MAAKKKAEVEVVYPRRVGFEGAVVWVDKRGDGRFSLRWREGGAWKKTTRNEEGEALGFAEEKVRKLARGTGERWVKAWEGEALEALRRVAGEMDLGRLVGELAGSVEILGGDPARLREAASYYVSSGPGGVVDLTLYAALDVVRAEYDLSRGATRNTMRVALDGMRRLMGDGRLAEVTREEVEKFVFEKGIGVRTSRNRLSQAGTFFGRCKALGFWPLARPLPTAAVKRPRLPDKAPEIFTPVQGKRLLARVMTDCPRYFSYLLLAGWVGCRPSECLRLRWEDVDFPHGTLHLSTEVVGKTARERWVPLDRRVVVGLRWARRFAWRDGRGEGEDRICLTRAREELSKLARGMGLPWPADVLRHSAITYALQLSGNDYGRTAERMGNSPAVIESNYRRPVPGGFGEAWMGLLKGCARVGRGVS
jgi:integrase